MNSVIFGNFSVTLTDRHGARLTRLPLRAPDPQPVRLPYGPDIPAPPVVVGREEQLALIRRAARDRGAVEFTGPCGVGKSTLLKNAAVSGVSGAPGAYLRVGGTELEDLLQDLTRHFYIYPGSGGRRLTTQECAQVLGNVSGVVVLDDVSYGPEQLGYLRRALPNCALVIGASAPVLGALGTSSALPGLPESAAVALLSRELGRFIPDFEMAAVRRLAAAVDGQPLYLRQAGALVRLDGRSLGDLADQAELDPGVLDELCISAAGLQAKRALAVLALAGGALLPGDLLSQMADIAYVSDTLESLTARGLAEQREDRFGLPVCKAEPYRRILYRYIGLASALRSLGAWLASCDPGGEEARGAVDAAVSLLGFAAEQREWEAVVRLTTVVERVLFVQGHWQAWQNTLTQGITAAQIAGDTVSEAYFTHQQGVQHFLHDRTDQARRLLRRALDLRTQLGDAAGAAVTSANLALLEPAAPPAPPQTSHTRRRVMTAIATVVAVIALGSAIGQAVGGSGDGGTSSPSSPAAPGSGGTDSGGTTTGKATNGSTTTGKATNGSTTTGKATSGGTTTGKATSGGTTTGRTTTGTSGGTPIPLSPPVITPPPQNFQPVHIYPGAEAQVLDFTVANPNDRPIAIDSVNIPDDTGFSSAADNCPDQLAANATCTVSIEFSPSRIGPASTQLTITSGKIASTPVELTGTGFVHLTVVLTGESNGKVAAEGTQDGTTCEASALPTQCVFDISAEGLQLTASISDSDYFFTGWSGACAGANPCVPALNQDGTVTATFAVRPPR
ncbi:hypothetical protein [Streptomyces sp. CA-106131]|uniref:hypothetical protein n=1 Tax=Streptomyces sp. CA-106131 TaxID=3240045 RepID=UPI003D9463CE